MKKIIYSRPDGGVSVVNLPSTATDQDFQDWLVLHKPDIAIDPVIIDRSQIPIDRTYRNGWVHAGDKVVHDIEKCKELHKDKLRILRKPLLEALDVQFMQALEKGQSTTTIVTQKQVLRDVTADPRIEAAKTIDDLKAITL